jgi:anti-sigma factor RsiW
MKKYSDERLVAYADKSLPEEERAEIDEYLRSSPDARKRLAELVETIKRVNEAFDSIYNAPIPDEVLQLHHAYNERLKKLEKET